MTGPGTGPRVQTRLLGSGSEAYARMLELIDHARDTVVLETYIYAPGRVGDRFRAALVAAAQRGVRVRALVDDFGSQSLPGDYFDGLAAAGGEVRRFNPRPTLRLSFRNHRKLLCCDGSAVIGGINIADEHEGDGVKRGWRDFALELRGPVVAALAGSFERMWTLSPFRRRDVRAFWKARSRPGGRDADDVPSAWFAGAGWRTGRLRRRLMTDLRLCREARAWVAYFLPSRRLSRALRGIARRGEVRVLLGRHSDVPLARWASERHFASMLRAGVKLLQYEPQVVHAKVIVADDVVYMGSANLDVRSLRINFELLVRVPDPTLAAELRERFRSDTAHATELQREQWLRSRRWWQSLRSAVAHTLLVRLDPYLAARRLDSLR